MCAEKVGKQSNFEMIDYAEYYFYMKIVPFTFSLAHFSAVGVVVTKVIGNFRANGVFDVMFIIARSKMGK
jgi:hypothetical protein